MKRFVLAIALSCALSGTALAGDIHSVDSQAPAPASIGTTSPSIVATIILTIIRVVG